MRVRHGALLAAVLGIVLAGSNAVAAAPPPGDAQGWFQDGYGPGNGGYNPDEHWIVPERLRRLAPRWSIPATGQQVCAAQSAPVVAGGRLFLTGRESLGAYDASTGTKIWSYPYLDPMDTYTPMLAVSGGTLLAATSGCQSVSDPSGMLLAFDAATGKLLWRADTDAPNATLIVARGVAVVGGEDAGWMETTAFQITTGKQLWKRPWSMSADRVAAGGTVLLTDNNREFSEIGTSAVDIGTGQVRWRTNRIWSVRAADRTGRWFLVDDSARALLKVDAGSGTVAWSQPGLDGPLAVDDRQVYATRTVTAGTTVTAELLGLALDSGRVAWRRGGFASLLRPVVAGGVLYALTPKKRLDTLNPATGAGLAFSTVDKPLDHPVISGDWLYLTDGGRLRGYTVPRPG